MVPRKGVGAATASAVIFSILVISNFVVFEASQGRNELYAKSDAVDSLADGAGALMGASATNILLEAQASLASAPLGCSSAVSAEATAIAGLHDLQRSGVLSESASARLYQGAVTDDNLSMVSPFDGGSPGAVDLALSMAASGNETAAGVSFSKVEVHVVHLSVRLQKLSDDCVSAAGAISQAVSSAAQPNCTSKSVAPLVEDAARGPGLEASGDGFVLGVAFNAVKGAGCTVDFTVSIEQADVVGPGGAFTVRLEESGAPAFGQQASQLQG